MTASLQLMAVTLCLVTISRTRLYPKVLKPSEDFSRRFKSLCRSTMAQKRSQGQKALRDAGKNSIWTASIEDIAETIISSQEWHACLPASLWQATAS